MAEEYSVEITKRFMELYRDLDPFLYGSSQKFEDFYNMHSVEIDSIRHMRNILVHAKGPGSYPFLVSRKTLSELESILGFLKTPCSSIGSSALCAATPEDRFAEIIETMAIKNYSFLPILSAEGKLVGVISENSILRAMAANNNEGLVYDSASKIADFIQFFKVEDNPNEFFEFKDPGVFLYQIEPDFSHFDAEQKKLGAIFVTDGGNPEGKVQRMITAWDLLPYLSKTYHYVPPFSSKKN
jgi:hypothetical protein